MASGMISPLRLAGFRLTSTNVGRALDTNSVTNNLAQQKSHKVSALHQMKGSLITKQSPLQRQTQQRQLDSQIQGVRSFHTSKCSQASVTSESLRTQEADDEFRRHHKEAIEYWVSIQNQMQGSLITKKSPLQRQNLEKQLNSQFQSMRSLHTNIRISDFVGEVHGEEDVLSLHSDVIKQQQQTMQEHSHVKGSLITNKVFNHCN
ncbi:unnamed protein product [Meganyctiphanes norvegica]|uniref:Uncharacterized protein n=1 Tax=Meganyctiphanes norvegica TaxID=48144 RepID=A0AAV2PRK7_MEGNR